MTYCRFRDVSTLEENIPRKERPRLGCRRSPVRGFVLDEVEGVGGSSPCPSKNDSMPDARVGVRSTSAPCSYGGGLDPATEASRTGARRDSLPRVPSEREEEVRSDLDRLEEDDFLSLGESSMANLGLDEKNGRLVFDGELDLVGESARLTRFNGDSGSGDDCS